MYTQTETPKTYQGWHNYETWRIALEFFDTNENPTGEKDAYRLSKDLKQIVEETLESSVNYESQNLALSYALSFIQEVNFYEIAQHILEMNKDEE